MLKKCLILKKLKIHNWQTICPNNFAILITPLSRIQKCLFTTIFSEEIDLKGDKCTILNKIMACRYEKSEIRMPWYCNFKSLSLFFTLETKFSEKAAKPPLKAGLLTIDS